LAQRLRDEGSEVVTKCHRLKMKAADEVSSELTLKNEKRIKKSN